MAKMAVNAALLNKQKLANNENNNENLQKL